MPFMQSLLLINSFATVDEMLRDTLEKAAEVFHSCPPDMPELAYNFFSVMANSKQLDDDHLRHKINNNPITLSGRNSLINGNHTKYYCQPGCLNSTSTWQQFIQVPIEVKIVHTLKNCVVNLGQTETLQRFFQDSSMDSREKLIVRRQSKLSTERTVQFVDGVHSLIDVYRIVIYPSGKPRTPTAAFQDGMTKCSMLFIFNIFCCSRQCFLNQA